MKKILALFLALALVFVYSSPSFATAVTADRANDGNDLTAGAAFDNLGPWILTVADNADFTTGVVTTAGNGGANAGTVTFAGTSIINTAISANVLGTGTNALLAVNAGVAGEVVTINGDAFTSTFTISGTGDVNADSITGTTVSFAANGVLSIDTGENITAVVSNSSGAAAGTLTLEGSTNISGQVGGAGVLALADVNAGANGSTSTFNGDVFSTQLDITGTGTVNIDSLTGNLRYQGAGAVSIDDMEDITGVISNSTGATAGTLTLEGSTTVSGQVGGAGVLALADVNAGANGSTSTFNGDIFATQLDITGTGTVNIDSLTGDLRYQGNGFVSIDTGEDITGVVSNSTGAAAGTLTLEGSTTVSGQVGGAGVLALADVNAGANGSTSTFNSDIFATQLDVTGTGIVNIDSLTGNLRYQANGTVSIDTAEMITGAVTTTVGGQGTLNFEGTHTTGGDIGVAGTGLTAVNIENGVLTMDHNVAATLVTVDSSAGGGAGTLALSGDRTLTGNLTLANSGVLSLGANDLTLGGTGIYTQAAGQTLNVTINDASSYGSIIAAGNAAVTGGTINVTVGNTYIVGGTTFTIIDSAGGAIDAAMLTYVDNSFALSFTGSSAAGDLTLTAVLANPYGTVSTDPNAVAVGKALEIAATSSISSDMQYVLTKINTLTSAKAIEDVLKTLHPDVSSGVVQGSRLLNSQFHNAIGSRLSYGRGGLASGIATGDMVQGAGFWMQGLGSHARQGEREDFEGYSARVFGTALGFDRQFGKNLRAGLAGGYGYGDIDSKEVSRASTNVHSFQTTLYGSYESGGIMSVRKKREAAEAAAARAEGEKLWYMDSMLSFMQNKYDSRREINLGSEARIASADHYGQQYSTKFEFGYTFTFDQTKALEITPFTSLGYSYLYMNEYKEKGAGAVSLNVDGKGFHQLQQGLGLKFGYPIMTKNRQVFIPSLRGSWLYDYVSSRFESSATFQGGGPAFETSGADPAKSAFVIGAELAFLNKGNLTLTGNFDWELRDAYSGYTYYATLRYDF